jgi:hypothetical protein
MKPKNVNRTKGFSVRRFSSPTNRFFIKVNAPGISTLVGMRGLRAFVQDDELVDRMIDRADECPDDVYVRRLRRGMTIRFYAK